MKTMQPAMIVIRRPIRSAKSPAIRAPKKCTSGENGCDERLLRGSQSSCIGAVDLLDEVVHAHNTADISRVIAEKDTTKSSEGTHQVCLDGDGSLNAIDIARGGDDGTARHVGSDDRIV